MSQFVYLEIASTLKGRINGGAYEEGRLPSERALTAEFGVQRATVRRALRELQEKGLIFRDATRGTFAIPTSSGELSPANREVMENGDIALVIGSAPDTTAPGDIARGMAQTIHAADRHLIWFDVPAHPGRAEADVPDPNDLLERGIAACALWTLPHAPIERLRALRDTMPVVLLDRRVPGFECDFVGIDDAASGQMVTEHLLGLGHRNIGFLSGSPVATSVQGRFQGWRTALLAAGVIPQEAWVLHKQGVMLEYEDMILENLLAGGGKPLTAVVCTNDTLAARVIAFLGRTGRRVGEDIAVTGFGNSFSDLLDAIGLTTVAQPFEQIGSTAGEILLERLRGGEETSDKEASSGRQKRREVQLSGTLVIRRSCGSGRSA